MAQHDIMKFLGKHRGKKFTSGEINKEISGSVKCNSVALAKLRKYRLVKYREIQGRTKLFLYWI